MVKKLEDMEVLSDGSYKIDLSDNTPDLKDISEDVSHQEEDLEIVFEDEEEGSYEESSVNDEPEEKEEEEKTQSRSQKRIIELNEKYRKEQEEKETLKKRQLELEEKINQLENSNYEPSQKSYDSQKAFLENEAETLKEKLESAYDTGDNKTIVDLQEKMGENQLKRIALQGTKPSPKKEEPKQQPQNTMPEKAKEWISNNPEFFQNYEFQQKVLSADNFLRAMGEDPNSEEFYTKLDKHLGLGNNTDVDNSSESDDYNEEGRKTSSKKERTARNVSPVGGSSRGASTRSGKGRVVKLTPEDRATAKKLGVSNEDFARQKKNATNTDNQGYISIFGNEK